MLHQLFALLVNNRDPSRSLLLEPVVLTQLYQALDWLQPFQTADTQQGKIWLNLKKRMGQFGAPASLHCKATSCSTARLLSCETHVFAVRGHASHQWLPHSCCTGAHWQWNSNHGLVHVQSSPYQQRIKVILKLSPQHHVGCEHSTHKLVDTCNFATEHICSR